MKKKDTPYIKFTKSDIAHIYLDKHNYDTWVVIELKSGTVIRSHSLALENLVVKEFKSYIAFGAIKHFSINKYSSTMLTYNNFFVHFYI